MTGFGGTPPRRPDQAYDPRPPGVVPGGREALRARVLFILPGGQGVVFLNKPISGGIVQTAPLAPNNVPGVLMTSPSNIVAAGNNSQAAIGMVGENAAGTVGPYNFAGSGQVGSANIQPGLFLVVGDLGFSSGGVAGGNLTANVVRFIAPTGDTTGVRDAARINGAYAAGVTRVVLLPGVFYVNAIVEIPGNCVLEGAMANEFAPSSVRMAGGGAVPASNLNAVVASTNWNNSSNANSLPPVTIRNLQIDGNSANQSGGQGHGLVLQSYASRIEDVTCIATRGDGFRFDFFGANGTSAIGNTMVENRWIRCKSISAGGRGFNTTDDNNHSAITDGFMDKCIVQSPADHGIFISASAGWDIAGCHLYGLTKNGIDCERPLMTRIRGNYIEPFGSNAAASFYNGIVVGNMINPNGATITGNMILSGAPGNAGSSLFGIAAFAAANLRGGVTITGNQLWSSQNASGSPTGIYIQGAAGSTTDVVHTGNQVLGTWTSTFNTVLNGGVINNNGAGT